MSADHCLHYYTCFFATIVCFSLSFAYRFPDIASLVDFLYCLVCLREILLDKKIKNMAQIQGGHCPWSKIQGGQPTTFPTVDVCSLAAQKPW